MAFAIIFDFDGIIVDSEPLHYRAFQRILEPLGLGYDWEEYVARYMGFDDREAFAEAFKARGRQLADGELARLVARKAAVFHEVLADGVTPYEGVVDLIMSLTGRCPLALCSGALLSDIQPILAMLGLSRAFDVIVTADDVAISKPDPASYVLAVQRLQQTFSGSGITAARCLAIEDTPAGIDAARGAGVKVVAVTNSYPAARLAAADLIVDSLARVTLENCQALLS
jgi:HAD superfamily hydrolase (TIGR01509 family)